MAAFKIIALVLPLVICQPGYFCKGCSISDIKVRTARSGRVVEGVPEYRVIISNQCSCSQSNLIVKCFDLPTVEPVNPAILKVMGQTCLVNSGKPIVRGKPVVFEYAFLQPTDLIPLSSKLSC
ncbi:hypothetical protein Ancab_006645 [Ancistrocladus abbreviatus]